MTTREIAFANPHMADKQDIAVPMNKFLEIVKIFFHGNEDLTAPLRIKMFLTRQRVSDSSLWSARRLGRLEKYGPGSIHPVRRHGSGRTSMRLATGE